MNEQLIVKNFGPIKDATVDFKKVTVFIGPTGGGKSTLAKLAAIFRDKNNYVLDDQDNYPRFEDKAPYKEYSIINYFNHRTLLNYSSTTGSAEYKAGKYFIGLKNFMSPNIESVFNSRNRIEATLRRVTDSRGKMSDVDRELILQELEDLMQRIKKIESGESTTLEWPDLIAPISSIYVPSERIFVASINPSFADLMRDDIGLPKTLLYFINQYFQVREEINSIPIEFLSVEYFRHDNKDYITFSDKDAALQLNETASGIQSVTPMMVLIEYLFQQKDQVQSFIIEEPELNLYPTAQQGLLNWLAEKCTAGENDLTITTHSPYILSHLNLLLYAYQVAEKHPDRADDVAKIVPRASWINPKEFAAYHVEGQKEGGVHSIVNPETGLISHNSLDSTATAETSEFEKLLDINAGLEVE